MREDATSLIVDADPVAVYTALTTAAAVEAWLPPRGMTGRVEEFDPRPGGRYRMVLTYASGTGGKTDAATDVVGGRFVEAVPGERLVQEVDFASDDPAFAGTMTMTWTLRPVGERTEVRVAATDVPAGIPHDVHVEGLASSLANLGAYLADRGGERP